MSLQATGKLIEKWDTQQVSERFKKREFVLETSEEINGNVYTNYAKFQLVQAKCDVLDRFSKGDQVTVSFNLKGNKFEKDGKINYITNLDAWKIESAGYVHQEPAQHAPAGGNSFAPPTPDGKDDLPF